MIPLTQGKSAMVDDEDYDWLNQWKWHFAQGYASRNSGSVLGLRKAIRMHREILRTPKGMDTDHINGNTLDNRRKNLRICTRAQNNTNTRVRKDNTSGFRGVTWHTYTRKWEAQININGKHTHLGLFKTPEEAALAYDQEAKKHHGEFARLNFPERKS